jgi:hypothetical protein
VPSYGQDYTQPLIRVLEQFKQWPTWWQAPFDHPQMYWVVLLCWEAHHPHFQDIGISFGLAIWLLIRNQHIHSRCLFLIENWLIWPGSDIEGEEPISLTSRYRNRRSSHIGLTANCHGWDTGSWRVMDIWWSKLRKLTNELNWEQQICSFMRKSQKFTQCMAKLYCYHFIDKLFIHHNVKGKRD